MKKVIVMLVVLSFVYPAFASDYLIEEFKEKADIAEVEAKLKNENKDFVKPKETAIEYKDKIFGEDCKVSLIFCMHKLYLMTVTWEAPRNKSKIEQAMMEKYGEPKINPLIGRGRQYAWQLDAVSRTAIRPFKTITTLWEPIITITLDLNEDQPLTKVVYAYPPCVQTGTFDMDFSDQPKNFDIPKDLLYTK